MPIFSSRLGMQVMRLALPVRSPYPLTVPCSWVAPADHGGDRVGHRAAGVVLGVDAEGLVAEVGVHLGDDALHLVRQRAAVGVTAHEARRRRWWRRPPSRGGVLGVGLVAVEEVLGVEEHPQAGGLEELDALRHHRHALVEGGAERLLDVEVPALADDAHGGRAGLHQRVERRVDVDLAGRPARGAEGHEGGGLQLQLGDGAPEELLVLRVRHRVAALDPRDAEPVELLGHLELVLDGEADPLELRPVAQGGVEDLDEAGEVGHVHSSTQVLYLSTLPRTTSPYASPISLVIGPGHGISRSSTELTALTSAAVPTTNISSAT